MAHLLGALYSADDLHHYGVRQRCSPQPGMRRVEQRGGEYLCWSYEDYTWTLQDRVTASSAAVVFWLADPWLPNQQFSYGNLSMMSLAEETSSEWSLRQWEEAVEALSFHVVMTTGARPHEVGPDSSSTSARVYQRLKAGKAAAQIYWSEGRSRLDDLRAECPVRTDLPPALRCVVLAEATVLLQRRPHFEGYIFTDEAPAGAAREAAAVLSHFDVPRSARYLLVR